MNIRFYNARVLSMNNNYNIIFGEIWVIENKIEYIGPNKPCNLAFFREIDCKGNLLMPSFKNAHTHSSMTFLRSFADDLPLIEWLEKQVFPMEAKIDGDDIYNLSKLAILEYLSSGISANFDMYFNPEMIAKASIDCGFRTVICGGISNFYGSVAQMKDWYNKFNDFHELISYKLGFHAEYTANIHLLTDISNLAKELKAPVFTHNSESKFEVDDCIKRTGKTPTAYLDELGIFDNGGGSFHNVHVTDQDISIFKKHDLYAITNPGSNCKLASGISPLSKFEKMGVKIGIGTDGPASNNALDMFREMFLATSLQKIQNNDASSMDAASVLKMATSTSANAMGLENINCLKVGNLADIILINLNRPNMQPLNNIVKNIVYSGSKENVCLTMVNGKILYENGEFFVGADANDIYKKANEIIQRITER